MRENIELINKLPIDSFEKYFLTLVYEGVKNSTYLGFRCYENEVCEKCNEKMNSILQALSLLKLPFHPLPVRKELEEYGNIYYYFKIYVSKNKRCLNKIINAETHKEFGKSFSIPRTAVRAFENDEKRLLVLPKQFNCLDCFIQFIPSEGHLEREMRIVKHRAKITKKKNPELYEQIISNI